MTGETDPIHKNVMEQCIKKKIINLIKWIKKYCRKAWSSIPYFNEWN